MRQAIIRTGAKQYLVAEGDQLVVELLKTNQKKIVYQPLLLIDGEKTIVGKPLIESASVEAEIIKPDQKQPKIIAIRFKAKKRVHKRRGHRQRQAVILIKSIKIAD